MTLGAQHLVLRRKRALDGAHENAALAVEVREDFLAERGLVHVPCAHSHTQGKRALLGSPARVLVHRNRRVDAAALEEQRAHGRARALGRNEHDVNIRGGDDA